MLAFLLGLALSPACASFIGINLGNVLEAPTEGAWAPVAQEYYFDDYVAQRFTRVRVPVRWDQHMATTAPYLIDATFLARVHEVVGWGLQRNLTVVVNSHHDDWMDNKDNFSSVLPRFLALWTQVADSFSAAPSNLLFEVINEPVSLTLPQLNELYSAVVPLMRANNPSRPIYLGGLSWMSPYWIAQNPDGVVFPPLASGLPDANLALETHSYDPYAFCLQNPPSQSSWGTPSDVAAVQSAFGFAAATRLPPFFSLLMPLPPPPNLHHSPLLAWQKCMQTWLPGPQATATAPSLWASLAARCAPPTEQTAYSGTASLAQPPRCWRASQCGMTMGIGSCTIAQTAPGTLTSSPPSLTISLGH